MTNGNVVDFPSKDVRDWAIIERSLRDSLRRANASAAAEQRIVFAMKQFHNILDPQFQFTIPDFSFEIDGTMSAEQKGTFRARLEEKISKASGEILQSFTKTLFVERLSREIEFCRELRLF